MMNPHLAPWREANGLVFVSGQLPFDPERAISATAIESQTFQVIANLKTILETAGLTLADVVKTNVWIKRREDFPGFDASYANGFGDHRPARSTVVCDLVLPNALIEIEAVALRP